MGERRGPEEQTLLILGASGDLTARLLLPGVGELVASGDVPGLSLLGSAVDDWDDDRWRARVKESFAAAKGADVDALVRSTRYVRADVTSEAGLRRLLDACQGPLVIYFALPPAVTVKACRALTEVALPEGTRLVLEKPFGTDAASADALNGLLTQLVPEDHVHRVDHFLGLSTVLNIVGLRFANRMLEPVLNAEHVERVDIVWDSTSGSRAGRATTT
jgi:glucose-6-phosphate 1-dehydrogenase